MAMRRPHWTPGISCSMAAFSSGGRSSQRDAATPVIPEPQNPSRYEVARAGVVEDVPEDRLVGDLRVVAVGHVDRVVLARSHVKGERLAVIGLLRVVGPAVMGDHVLEERVRAER